ncbi:hypothetical protein GCM10027300_12680 [Modestobacter lapidis]
MLIHRVVTQPGTHRVASRNIDALMELLASGSPTAFDAAVAYVTDSGVDALVAEIGSSRVGPAWLAMRKRWLVSCDWLRSDPTALNRLQSMPFSEVRVHDGDRVVARPGCVPFVPWHPKWFAIRGRGVRGCLCGSGNLSRNGLLTGHEVGVLQIVTRPTSAAERSVDTSLRDGESWFERQWRAATPLGRVLDAYAAQFSKTPQGLARNDDVSDATGGVGSRYGLTPAQLVALSTGTHFWIEAGILSRNRGPGRPGNQLMMSALMRVFFGAEASEVPQNTLVARPIVEHPIQSAVRVEAPIRFSDNSMDVISLPVPDAPWPASYDDQTLMFSKVNRHSSRHFILVSRNAQLSEEWRQKSMDQGTSYEMRSGRRWGVYS